MRAHFFTLRRKQRQVDAGQRLDVLQKERRRIRVAEVRIHKITNLWHALKLALVVYRYELDQQNMDTTVPLSIGTRIG